MTFGGSNSHFGVFWTPRNGEYLSNFVLDIMFYIDKSTELQENRCCSPRFRGKNIHKRGVPGQVSPGNPGFWGCFEKFFEDLQKWGVPIELCPGTPKFGRFFPRKPGVPWELFPRIPDFIGYGPPHMGFQYNFVPDPPFLKVPIYTKK